MRERLACPWTTLGQCVGPECGRYDKKAGTCCDVTAALALGVIADLMHAAEDRRRDDAATRAAGGTP